jgi:hypothetical protein
MATFTAISPTNQLGFHQQSLKIFSGRIGENEENLSFLGLPILT